MSTIKTRVNPELIENFIKDRYGEAVSVETIADGELSQAFFFDTEDGEKVLRVNSSSNDGFLKDKYATEHFSVTKVPIPTLYEIGKLKNDMFFAISNRADGKTLDKFNREEIRILMPEIIATLDAIHATPPAGEKYGWLRPDGDGKSDSWHEAIIEMQKAEDDDKLGSISFFDYALHEKVRAEIREYYDYCPDARVLIHGDYGFNNVLSDYKNITGVIDWHDSMYGDPLYDVAWLDFWGGWQADYAQAFRQHYEIQNNLPSNFEQRITCYKLIIGANSLCFFAKSDQQEKHAFAAKTLSEIKR